MGTVRRNEITYPLEPTFRPLSCDDINFIGFIILFQLRYGQRIRAYQAATFAFFNYGNRYLANHRSVMGRPST